MKITRLQSGYRINVTDGELEVLNSLIVDGFMMHEGDDVDISDGWSAAEKSALTRMLKKTGQQMALLRFIDADRRTPTPETHP